MHVLFLCKFWHIFKNAYFTLKELGVLVQGKALVLVQLSESPLSVPLARHAGREGLPVVALLLHP